MRLADGNAGLETAEHDDPPIGGVGEAILVAPPFAADAICEGERHEEIQRLAGREIGEMRVGDADNRGGGAVEANGPADGGGAAPKARTQ